jgi:hypothetical protein
MSKATSSVSQGSTKPPGKLWGERRNYPGEPVARKLIEWLNEPDAQLKEMRANPPDHIKAALSQGKNAFLAITPAVRERRERVEIIIGLWQSLTDYIAEVVRPYRSAYYGVPPAWEIRGGTKTREKLEHDRDYINFLLKRYSGHAVLVGIDSDKSSVKTVGPHGSGAQIGDAFEIRDERGEWDSIGVVIRLAADGLLGRVQRCEYCKRWLYKRFQHQTCCSGGKCRQQKYRSSPEWKEHRRRWRRKNYRQHKVIDQGR